MKHLLLPTIAAVVLVVGCGPTVPDISIHVAVKSGNIEAVKQHLVAGTDVNAKSKGYGRTPLRYAARYGHKEIAELLIANGADVNSKADNGKTPLDWADGETADILRKHGGKTGDWLNADKSIHKAARAGHIEAVKQHLAAGTDVDAKDMNGWTPLHHAALNGQKETTELLIAEGADVNANDRGGSTPLLGAAYRGHKEIVELLIAEGADVNAKADNGKTPLDRADGETADILRKHGGKHSTINTAATAGDAEAVKEFLATGAEVNAKDEQGRTAIYMAAKTRKVKKEITELLIEKGADVNVKAVNGATPLHFVKNKEVAELLIEKGADVNVKDKWDSTPLHYAAYYGRKEIVELLVNNGANIEAKDLPRPNVSAIWFPRIRDGVKSGRTPLGLATGKTKTFLENKVAKLRAKESLHGAVSDNDIQLVKQHLAAGANVNAKNEQGETPIHLAARTRKVKKEITELLIEKGADVNVKAVDGATPLHRVATTEIAELLIEKGADVNVKDRKGRTPLDFAVTGKRAETEELIRKNGGERGEYKMTIYQAASIGDLETVEKLLESGTDVNQKNRQGYTPLMAAGTKEIAEFLISKGASVNESTIFGTALHEAVNSRRYEVAKVLLENGASVNAKTNVGKTPLDRAARKTADLLRKHGGKTGEELKAAGK